jgi:hypothetical protein
MIQAATITVCAAGKKGGAEEARKSLRFERKPIGPKNAGEMPVRMMKAEMVRFHPESRHECIHPALVLPLDSRVEFRSAPCSDKTCY